MTSFQKKTMPSFTIDLFKFNYFCNFLKHRKHRKFPRRRRGEGNETENLTPPKGASRTYAKFIHQMSTS